VEGHIENFIAAVDRIQYITSIIALKSLAKTFYINCKVTRLSKTAVSMKRVKKSRILI